ncbi:MAG: HAD family hydrolase [Bacteroidales bacterium]|nr:HAD family hydrolase [Bacteroidales bacterium]
MSLANWDIKKDIAQGDWALFLDRDGVINRRIVADYVKRWEDFEFLPGVLESFPVFAKYFKHIFIITNQQGVGKGMMTAMDLEKIHRQMKQEIENTPCKINGIYFCPSLAAENSPRRKPNPGMALEAKSDFPNVDLAKSIMVGDSPSDIEFGINAGMQTIFIGDRKLLFPTNARFSSLSEFAKSLK